MATLILKPAEEFGPLLTGRSLAQAFRGRVETAASADEVILDFSGVRVISPSFADELFAKIPSQLLDAGRIRFTNLSDELLSAMRFVQRNRRRRTLPA